MLFVGHNTAEILHQHYLTTIGDVARCRVEMLEKLLGKFGPVLWRYANGLDDSRVLRIGEGEPLKSISNGMTFRRNLQGYRELKSGVVALSDEVAERLREEGLRCCGVQVMLREPGMRTITRQMPLLHPTCLQKELVDASMKLIEANWPQDAPVRAMAITAMKLKQEDEACDQTSLTADAEKQHERFDHAEMAMQKLRRKYGRSCIAMGFVEDESMGIRQFVKKEEKDRADQS